MSELIVRRATPNDAGALAGLIDGFAKGHPAELHTRSLDRMREAFFGNEPLAYALLAERNETVIGFGAWRKTYDVFWSMYGGEGIGLYVSPEHRGHGAAICIIAAICAEIRRQGGHFLISSYSAEMAPLYERVGVGGAGRSCHVSALAFATLAGAAGSSPREIVRSLPDKTLNYVPVNANPK